MCHDREYSKLRVSFGSLGVGDDGNALGTDDERLQLGARPQSDGLSSPLGRFLRSSDDEQATRTLETSSEPHDVDGPTEALSRVWCELHLDDDAEHGLALDEEHHHVRAVLGRYDVRELRRLEPHFRINWQVEMQRLTQELGR